MLKRSSGDNQWQHPKELLKIQKLKFKKQALQERINGNTSLRETKSASNSKAEAFENIFSGKKRKNPFVVEENQPKKSRSEDIFFTESADQTLFKLLNQNNTSTVQGNNSLTTFSGILSDVGVKSETQENAESKTPIGTSWCPIDWTLKRKIRLISSIPFPWSPKLKISEEASGITSYARCLDIDQCNTSLDVSPNARFHQCCLYWQQPFLPWLSLFPRNTVQNSTNGINLSTNAVIKNSLYETWTDSLKSLYQLIRTRQCPYFYVCANSFTALFRAAGIIGHTDLHVMVTPTTRGFRNLLKEEDIEFEMPLKSAQTMESQECDESENLQEDNLNNVNGPPDGCNDNQLEEEWLTNLGVNADDIKSINYTQARLEHKVQCQVDSSNESLILIKGVEVNSFFNFLINCKSTICPTGPLAGVPPTLLAPVSFHGATLNRLKVKENKMHSDGADYYSLELTGPILPSTIHNILNINTADHSITVTFSDLESTRGFSKASRKTQRKSDIGEKGTAIFGKENLSDCGLNYKVLKHFCSPDLEIVSNIECLKYSGETQSFTWT